MINILINTKNVYSKHAIKQLVLESVATDEDISFQDSYTQYNIAQAHIIFTEMEPGEIFLCNDELKYRTNKSLLFILQEKKNEYLPTELTNCTKNCFFIYKADSIPAIRNKINAHINEFRATENEEAIAAETISCINCPCKSITHAQSKVVHALSLGLNQMEIAHELKINYKTVYSHKKNVMHDFKIKGTQDLNKFLNVLMKRKQLIS
ncbi:helix-turn-helix transcriptional regulator [Klebsiella oxytoca]|uniref:LuxR family transcriptional regulator n=1 Tax=Klebsiella oxytoca TaxID=571 RepID=A0A6B8MS33_KLEOX|nr:LuxR C-terminal-related transcriptional regulator [Klebsiella oxytoca]QGN37756.1 LuxR family transcriptional regulator [Klebsiella oxytoca]